MKAIMISDKPKWCALMMNGEKKTEVRKGTALYKATKKLIDEYGYAEFYVYCTKDKKDFLVNADLIRPPFPHPRTYMLGHKDYSLNGKVLFKFRCYKVEEVEREYTYNEYAGVVSREWLETNTCNQEELSKKTCLTKDELFKYLDNKTGYAIHISDLEIFDRPKELSEFIKPKWHCYRSGCPYFETPSCNKSKCKPKAPQSWCYVEVER